MIERVILELCAERGAGKSICPTEAAKAWDIGNWRARLPAVRAAAVHLARRGDIVITRKGRPVDPDHFKGIYRLSLSPAPARPDDGDA